MRDLVFWSQTKAQFETFAKGKGFMVDVEDDEGNVTTQTIRHADLCWWAGNGKMLTKRGTYDEEGNELTAPEFSSGYFCYVRLSGDLYEQDRKEPDPQNDNPKSWDKSKLASDVRGNGNGTNVLGGAVSAYQDGPVRIVDPVELQAYLAANGLPGHEWQGGNSF